MRWMLVAALAGMIAAAPAAAQERPRTATFSVDSMQFEATLPQDYCVSDAAHKASVRAELQLTRCGDVGREHDFYAVKLTPNIEGGNAPTTRATLFARLRPTYDAPDAEERFAAMTDSARRKRNVDFEGGWKPMGMDDICAYIGAQVAIGSGDAREDYVQGICVTVIGGRTFAIYSTGRGATVEDLARQISATRTLALGIRPVTAE